MNRLDKEVHTRGLTKSRTAAAELITAGGVTVNGAVCVKPSHPVEGEDVITVTGGSPRYVSRGGLKLEHALNAFAIDLDGTVCLDVGASTGGFTDCMLKHGAAKVYAVDVGTAQLEETLRNNERVVSLEKTDIRSVKLPEPADFFTVDVSFISVKLILPVISGLCRSHACGVVLIKPQFELGKRHKGVITDRKQQDKIAADIVNFASETGFTVKGVTDSPITGGSGNREFLMCLSL